MKTEINFFGLLGVFFAAVALLYGMWTDWVEPVGWVALFLSAGMGLMIAFFLWIAARKLPLRPDDDEDGEIEQAEGPYGAFAPYSWWPLWLALAAALIFLGVGVGMWIAAFGAILGVWALCGWVFEYYTGEHAH